MIHLWSNIKRLMRLEKAPIDARVSECRDSQHAWDAVSELRHQVKVLQRHVVLRDQVIAQGAALASQALSAEYARQAALGEPSQTRCVEVVQETLSAVLQQPVRKRGCPTCQGVEPGTCKSCQGFTFLEFWYYEAGKYWYYSPAREAHTL